MSHALFVILYTSSCKDIRKIILTLRREISISLGLCNTLMFCFKITLFHLTETQFIWMIKFSLSLFSIKCSTSAPLVKPIWSISLTASTLLHQLVLSIELGTVQTGTGKVDPARKFKYTTAARRSIIFVLCFSNSSQYFCLYIFLFWRNIFLFLCIGVISKYLFMYLLSI